MHIMWMHRPIEYYLVAKGTLGSYDAGRSLDSVHLLMWLVMLTDEHQVIIREPKRDRHQRALSAPAHSRAHWYETAPLGRTGKQNTPRRPR